MLETNFKLEFAEPGGFCDDWRRTDDAEVGELIDLHAWDYEIVNGSLDLGITVFKAGGAGNGFIF